MQAVHCRRLNELETKTMKLKLHWQIIIGLVSGILFGIFAAWNQWSGFTQDWIAPFGTIFVNLLKLIAITLTSSKIAAKNIACGRHMAERDVQCRIAAILAVDAPNRVGREELPCDNLGSFYIL